MVDTHGNCHVDDKLLNDRDSGKCCAVSPPSLAEYDLCVNNNYNYNNKQQQ